MNFRDWMRNTQERVDRALGESLPEGLPQRLHEAMRYSALGGGKRVRPLLVFAAGELSGAAEESLLVCAMAVELIHTYSLIHDDLPAMDNDTLRRGRPTCHVAFGEATALLAGDALQARAFGLLALPGLAGPATQLEMLAALAHASGSEGMAGGQAIDLESVGKALSLPDLELMHMMKTGALIRASAWLGMLAGKPMAEGERGALDAFGKRVGLLFQVVDDVLDCTASTADLGKTAGKDANADKPTFASLMGEAAARAYAEDLRAAAIAALAPFGGRARRLKELTDFICQRTH
jgi:farnesyl diphosphate synthase